MPIPFTPIITEAGLQKAAEAIANGLQVAITHIQLGTANYTPSVNGDGHAVQTALTTPKQTVAIAGGGPVPSVPHEVRVSGYVTAATGDSYFAGEVGFWAGVPGADGSVLMAVYSHPTVDFAYISDLGATVLQYAFGISAFPKNSITVTVDPDASALVMLMEGHLAAANPHPQYITRAEMPAGILLLNAGTTAPSGTLPCDGASYPTADFPFLFERIGYTWGGTGDTFKVPDFRGRTPIGSGSGSGMTSRVLGTNGGAETHTLTTAQLPAHNHNVPNDSLATDYGLIGTSAGGGTAAGGFDYTAGEPNIQRSPPKMADTGGGQSHNNMPPFAVVNIVITTGSPTAANDDPLAPTISYISPTAGAVGTPVSIIGANLNGATAISFNGTAATITPVSPTQVNTVVPAGATTGSVTVTTGHGTAISPTPFSVTVEGAPVITSFTPTGGPEGTVVTIRGSKFVGTTQVTFNSVVVTSFTVDSDTQITATVPVDATTGPITVTNAAATTTSTGQFAVGDAPTITSFSPSHAPAGDQLTINGTGFLNRPDTVVKVGNSAAINVVVVSETRIVCTVPHSGLVATHTYTLHVTEATGTADSATDFTYDAPGAGAPTITAINPGNGPVGTAVTITGTNFDSSYQVFFADSNDPSGYVQATSGLTQTATQITANVPVGATTGNIKVTTTAGVATSPSSFLVTQADGAPVINSFTPTGGPVGTQVSIFGNHFDDTGQVGVDVHDVRFNGTAASFSVVSNTQVNATVPAGATDGPITLTTINGEATSPTNYDVTGVAPTPPTISGFNPLSGPIGTQVTISGTGFDSTAIVRFNGVTASQRTVLSSTQIKATVPTGATSGKISIEQTSGAATSTQDFTVGTLSQPLTLNITQNQQNYDAFAAAGRPTQAVNLTINVASGVSVTSKFPTTTAQVEAALKIMGFAPGSTFLLNNDGAIWGGPGQGGIGGSDTTPSPAGRKGGDGGHGVLCQSSITVNNTGSDGIRGGGGGGSGGKGDPGGGFGGGGGGGGAYMGPGGAPGTGANGNGSGGANGPPIYPLLGGAGGAAGGGAATPGGNGGGTGKPGKASTDGTAAGGAAGYAIKVMSGAVTFQSVGTVIGPTGP